MLIAMKSKWLTILVGVIATVVVASVAIGLASPDGSVDDQPEASATPTSTASTTPTRTPAPTPTATPSATTAPPSVDRAPAAVSGTWPGRPASTTARGSDVDWCPAVRTTGAHEAVRVFGRKATDAAACAAVRFMFEQRYSRLSLPRRSYEVSDFDFVTQVFTDATATVYRPRIDRFIADPDSVAARKALGLVLLRGKGTGGDAHASAGRGRVLYGPAFTTRGYRDRAAWINPTWSKVDVRVDRAKAEPRIVATLTASAAVPVFATTRRRDDMMTIPTSACLLLRHEGGRRWLIGGWTSITSGPRSYAKLAVK